MAMDRGRDRQEESCVPARYSYEVLNPKTALFFLSFLPQFVNPALGHVVGQFLLLGIMSVSLNTTADLLVVAFAAPLGARLRSSARFRRNQRVASGVGMIGTRCFCGIR